MNPGPEDWPDLPDRDPGDKRHAIPSKPDKERPETPDQLPDHRFAPYEPKPREKRPKHRKGPTKSKDPRD